MLHFFPYPFQFDLYIIYTVCIYIYITNLVLLHPSWWDWVLSKMPWIPQLRIQVHPHHRFLFMFVGNASANRWSSKARSKAKVWKKSYINVFDGDIFTPPTHWEVSWDSWKTRMFSGPARAVLGFDGLHQKIGSPLAPPKTTTQNINEFNKSLVDT